MDQYVYGYVLSLKKERVGRKVCRKKGGYSVFDSQDKSLVGKTHNQGVPFGSSKG
jgi:hypothetical protein